MGTRRRTRVTAALLVLTGLVLAGCSGAPDTRDGRPGTDAAEPLLAFSATTLDGRTFDGTTVSGKPAVLWFWAPWCPVCLQQAPGVREAVAMPEFVRLAKVEAMIHLADEAGVVWRRFKVTEQSTFVFLDAAGRVAFRGRLDAADVPDRVAALLPATG